MPEVTGACATSAARQPASAGDAQPPEAGAGSAVGVEGAAGVAVAGYLKEKERWRGRRVVIVLCGANVSLERLREVIA